MHQIGEEFVKRIAVFVVAVCAGLLEASGAYAAAIAWSGPTAITSADAALEQPGTIVGAEAWGSGGNTTVTLGNGEQVYFQQGTLNGANAFASTSGGHGVTSNNTAQYHGTTNTNFNKALGDFEYDGTQTLTFKNLVVGQTYAAQIFALDDRTSCCGNTVQYYTDPLGDASASYVLDQNDYIIGAFVADATTETITIHNGAGQVGGTGAPETNLNAAVLYSVPEPSTLALLAAGIFGMAWMRRSRNAAHG